MDTIKAYSDVIKKIMAKYAQFKPSHGNIRLDTLFDDLIGEGIPPEAIVLAFQQHY